MPGRCLSYWIGEVLRDARMRAGITTKVIAAILDMNERKVIRVEGGEGEEAQSYQNIDEVVNAYAYALGIDDPRLLWVEALERWFGEGGVPAFTEDHPHMPGPAFVRPIREEAQRRLQSRGEPVERLRAIQRKKRGGR